MQLTRVFFALIFMLHVIACIFLSFYLCVLHPWFHSAVEHWLTKYSFEAAFRAFDAVYCECCFCSMVCQSVCLFVCLSRACFLQRQLNGSRFCLGEAFLGVQGILCQTGVPIALQQGGGGMVENLPAMLWGGRGDSMHCQVTLATCNSCAVECGDFIISLHCNEVMCLDLPLHLLIMAEVVTQKKIVLLPDVQHRSTVHLLNSMSSSILIVLCVCCLNYHLCS